MGAKTWILVYSDESAAAELGKIPEIERRKTDKLIRKLFRAEHLESTEDGDLSYTCPRSGEIFAGYFDGVFIVAAEEFGIDYPSRLPARFIDASMGKTVTLHAMHSVTDWFAFAQWKGGELVRSLSLSPDSGVIEDIGEKMTFEKPYWDGQYPAVDPEEEEDDYPFPFHPLELGEAALKSFFGYQLEGALDETLFKPEEVPLMGYVRKASWWKRMLRR